MTKISIITCSYNRSKKLQRNIESIQRQKYENYEHYIIDDGSTDDTREIVNKLNSFKKIKYIRFEKNEGQPAVLYNSNIFNIIDGDLVIILDSDDHLLDGAFDIILSDFKKYDSNKVISINYDWEIKEINEDISYQTSKGQDLYRMGHPRMLNNKGFRDYLSVRKIDYYNLQKKYFLSPKHWYISYYNICMLNEFDEIYTNRKIYEMSFDEDTVTRGFNIEKYAKWSLFSREYLFNNYGSKMDSSIYVYSIKSLIINYLVNPNNRIKVAKIISSNKKFFIKNFLLLISILIMMLVPTNILFKIKKIVKTIKQRRA